MRIRSIRPEFWSSRSMGRVSREARLLFIGLWSLADDEGRIRCSEKLIASLLFPEDEDVTSKIVADWLDDLVEQGSVLRYEVDAEHYLQILNWRRYQRIEKVSASNYPPPPPSKFDDLSPNVRRTLAEDSPPLKEGRGEERKGRESKSACAGAPADTSTPFALRAGKKVPARRFGDYVLLTDEEYERLCRDWGKRRADQAIERYDRKIPNSPRARGHTDHNRALRDYADRGFLGDLAPIVRAKLRPTVAAAGGEDSEVASPEDVVAAARAGREAIDRGASVGPGARGGDPASSAELVGGLVGAGGGQ